MAKRFSDADLIRIRNSQGENLPVPKERKKPGNEESRIQRAVIQWWALAHKAFGVREFLLFAIPNGGRRDVITASIMKAEGVRRGTSDLFLAVPMCGRHGLWIEMKAPDGVLKPEQKTFQDEVAGLGYAVSVCRSFNEAMNLITDYLKGQ
jgi:hypothetical protein